MRRKVLCRLKLKKEWEFKVIALWQNMFETASSEVAFVYHLLAVGTVAPVPIRKPRFSADQAVGVGS
jgi:hypothetical protein